MKNPSFTIRTIQNPISKFQNQTHPVADIVAITLCALVLYTLTMLPGPGWGAEAALQTHCILLSHDSAGAGISPIFSVPAHFFTVVFPMRTLAWRFNVFMELLAVGTLIFVYLSVRMLVNKGTAAIMASTALAFSPAFYLHAVRPSIFPMTILFFSAQIYFSLKTLLSGQRMFLVCVIAFAVLASLVEPGSALVTFPPAIYLVIRSSTHEVFRRRAIVAGGLLAFAILVLILGGYGTSRALTLAVFCAFQVPFIGWLLVAFGARQAFNRIRPAFECLLLALPGCLPFGSRMYLSDLLGSMLYSSIVLAVCFGVGVDYLYERLHLRREKMLFVAPILFAAVVLLPLLTTASAANLAISAGLDQNPSLYQAGIILRNTPWSDSVWYVLWPPKNGQGGYLFIDEAEKILPASPVVVLADPEIAPVIDFAQRVEHRLANVVALEISPEQQLQRLSSMAQEGHRIFLAGTDPAFYDLDTLGRNGEIVQAGRMYEWIPAQGSK